MIYKIVITCCCFIAVYARDTFINSRIIGGTEANKGEFPHLVSIQFLNSQHNCGGSILNEKWILTAAHCVPLNQNDMLIKAGKHNVKIVEEYEQSSIVEKIIVHKNYVPTPALVAPFDLALLKLKTPFKYTRNVIPIQLCKRDSLPKNATIAGWGTVSNPGASFPDTLKKVTLPLIDLKTCNDSILAVDEKSVALHKTNICTGPLMGGHGTCFGDSGSPLISYETGNPELIGVFSWITLPCAAPGRVSVYVRVSAFIDWIQEIISIND